MITTTITGPTNGTGSANTRRGFGETRLFPGGEAWKGWDGTNGDFKCTDKNNNPVPFCFGIGDKNDQIVTSLQAVINRFAAQGGFTPIAVGNHKLGSDVVKAAVKAAKVAVTVTSVFQALPLGPRTALTIFSSSPAVDKVALAAVAPWLLEGFTKIADVMGLPAKPALTPAPTPAPMPASVTTTLPEVPETEAPDMAAGIQQLISICQDNPRDPACAQARAGCQSVRGTPQGNLPVVQQFCAAIKPKSTVVWWIVGGVAAAATVGVVGYAVYRGRQKRRPTTEPTRFRRRPRGEFAPSF